MGQYFKIVNQTKREYITPGYFCDGSKFLELGTSRYGSLLALSLLLRQSKDLQGRLGVGGSDYTEILRLKYVKTEHDKLLKASNERKVKRGEFDLSIVGNAPKELWEYLGRWVGDAIAIVGDYDETEWHDTVWNNKSDYIDISEKLLPMVELVRKSLTGSSEKNIQDTTLMPDAVISSNGVIG